MRETRALDYSYDSIDIHEAKKRGLHRRIVELLTGTLVLSQVQLETTLELARQIDLYHYHRLAR